MSVTLETKVSQLGPQGKRLAGKLHKLEIETVRDLIFYYPFRYEDYSRLYQISQLAPGLAATVVGKIELIASRRSFRRRRVLTEAVLTDGSGSIKLIWFNQPWIIKNLQSGDRIRVWGKINGDVFNLYFNSPAYQKDDSDVVEPAGIMPIYPLTAGLTNRQLGFLIKQVLPLTSQIDDYLPPNIISREKLLDLNQSLEQIHFPRDKELLMRAKRRLAFDELFLLQSWSEILRRNLDQLRAPLVKFSEAEIKRFVKTLPFTLTNDQRKAAWEVIKDLEKPRPMNRLLEGDVGSGKTVVAVLAMYDMAMSGYQSALMAPTEILAFQHYQNISKLLTGSGIKVGLLTRTQKVFNNQEIESKEFLRNLSEGIVDIVIGTHALISEGVSFAKLGLVIVDEQHRFGVRQRQELARKSQVNLTPHFLSLTATPIPRSLALVLYGDLDLSIIRELPQGRRPIITSVVSPQERVLAYDFIRAQIQVGRQVFVICPLIDPSDKLGVRSVSEEHKKLDQEIYPDLAVGLLHGKLKGKEKEEIMRRFKNNEIKILVSTSVVEVGVDVPNATVMMIEGADRFGLSQLHQFRGRVGRDKHQSHCFLFTDSTEDRVLERLKFLATCSDGFALAEYDLQSRGAGMVFGEKQSGFLDNLKIADPADLILAKEAKEAAKEFVKNFDLNDFPKLAEKIENLGFTVHRE
jgi:ATP-dependent DNA helicase RecG